MYEKGWSVDYGYDKCIYYYEGTTREGNDWKADIYRGTDRLEDLTIYADAKDSTSGYKEYFLHDLFSDKFNPTEAERTLFLIETGIPYVDQEILDKLKR